MKYSIVLLAQGAYGATLTCHLLGKLLEFVAREWWSIIGAHLVWDAKIADMTASADVDLTIFMAVYHEYRQCATRIYSWLRIGPDKLARSGGQQHVRQQQQRKRT